MGGGLAAVDTVAGKGLYRQFLDGYNRYNRYTYGVAASPTLAGRSIYITDDAGYTHIIQPGPQFKELGRTKLEDTFHASPAFADGRVILRGATNLWCLGKSK